MLNEKEAEELIEILADNTDTKALKEKVASSLSFEDIITAFNRPFGLYKNFDHIDDRIVFATNAYLYTVAARDIMIDYLKKRGEITFETRPLSSTMPTVTLVLTYNHYNSIMVGNEISFDLVFNGTCSMSMIKGGIPVSLDKALIEVRLALTIDPKTSEVYSGDITGSLVSSQVRVQFLTKYAGKTYGGVRALEPRVLGKITSRELEGFMLRPALFECQNLFPKIIGA